MARISNNSSFDKNIKVGSYNEKHRLKKNLNTRSFKLMKNNLSQ